MLEPKWHTQAIHHQNIKCPTENLYQRFLSRHHSVHHPTHSQALLECSVSPAFLTSIPACLLQGFITFISNILLPIFHLIALRKRLGIFGSSPMRSPSQRQSCCHRNATHNVFSMTLWVKLLPWPCWGVQLLSLCWALCWVVFPLVVVRGFATFLSPSPAPFLGSSSSSSARRLLLWESWSRPCSLRIPSGLPPLPLARSSSPQDLCKGWLACLQVLLQRKVESPKTSTFQGVQLVKRTNLPECTWGHLSGVLNGLSIDHRKRLSKCSPRHTCWVYSFVW